MKSRLLSLLSVATVLPIATTSLANALIGPLLTPQSVSSGAAGDCHNPGVSADGRFVVFVSAADNLVTNDSNGAFDVFVRDRQLGKTLLVSVNSSGTRSGNAGSQSPTISANGQFVVFESAASDLVANDTNNASDVFLRDLVAGTTTLVSVSSNGVSPGNLESSAPTITPDGRYVLFASRASDLAAGDANNAVDLFVRDTIAGTTTLVTRNSANTASFAGQSAIWDGNRQISDDGRWMSFHSSVANLVASDTNAKLDVFLRDLQTSSTAGVSTNTSGTGLGNGDSQAASMDAAGRFLAFQSAASNVATNDTNTGLDVFLRDHVTGTTKLVSVNTNGTSSSSTSISSGSPVLSKQGNVVVFLSTANNLVAGDTNSSGADLFRRDLTAGTTTLMASGVSVLTYSPAARFAPVLSPDGSFVLYQDTGKNLVLYDVVTTVKTTIATNVPGADAVMTDDANWIAYVGPPETTGVRNIYFHDRQAGTTELISLREPGLPIATGSATSRMIPGGVSSNGQFVVFETYAADLDTGDNNRTSDVWLGELNANSWIRLNTVVDGFARGPARRPVISDDGRWVAYEAIPDSTPLAGLGTRFSLYAFDRVAQTNVLIAGVGKVSAPSNPVFSQTGGFMAFQSSETGVGGYATAVGQIYYRDLAQASNRLVTLNYQGTAAGSGASSNVAISPDGRFVAYLSGPAGLVTNSVSGANAFLWDSMTASNIVVSGPGSTATPVTRVIFASGDLLAFERLTNTYLFDIVNQTSITTLTDAVNVAFSADGRFAACERRGSYSPLDTNGTTDVYLINRTNGQASLVSANRAGTAAGNSRSLSPLITPDGRYVLFRSRASNLTANDTNGMSDVFLRDLTLGRTILLSINCDATGTGNRFSGNPIMSTDGSTVLFESYASDLVTGDYNDARDIMVLRLSRSDTDGDGLPDDWELAYFNGLQRDGTGDSDGDGRSDAMEFQAGTDPTNVGSVLRVITLSPPSSGPVQVFWSSVPGKQYRVQFKASMIDPAWNDLAGDVTATDATGFKEDATVGTAVQRYYRVLLVP